MTKILRFPCDLARTMRNTLREKQGDIIKTKIPIFYWYYMSLLSC